MTDSKTGHMGLFSFTSQRVMPVDHRVVAAEVHRQDEFHHRDLACRHR